MNTLVAEPMVNYHRSPKLWSNLINSILSAELDTYPRESELAYSVNLDFYKEAHETGLSEFQKYLLSWPTMTDEELSNIEEKRKHFNEWK